MKIVNNRIQGVDFRRSPNQAGLLRSNNILVIHDDEGASMAGTTSWILNPSSKVSYHVLVGKNGEVVQFVEFNRRAYHAGVSSWKGLSDLNWHSIGVSMQNRNKETYTEGQIAKAIEVCRAIVQEYGIKEIVGHRDISPGRKTDPNDSFPWGRFHREVFGSVESADRLIVKKVTASGLNVRSSPNSSNATNIITSIVKGTEVMVLGEQAGWSEVVVCSSKIRGWVSSRHIK